jgi:hypothetical protein
MKLSEAIKHFQQMVDEHGDMDFRLCDLTHVGHLILNLNT